MKAKKISETINEEISFAETLRKATLSMREYSPVDSYQRGYYNGSIDALGERANILRRILAEIGITQPQPRRKGRTS